ncbi:hypothetical protein BJV78DRAFT_1220289 [Lactifluus subvellereus]|nr:hypothetical protein BJV78DRAFT_1220289 [Lactifluus subvellereus]
MASCYNYWAEHAQLHPWFRPAIKRKLPTIPTMFPRSESPSPVDEYRSDTRMKRQRRITLEQTPPKKRKLPSPPQSPIEDGGDARFLKRQRCTALERGIERLSLIPAAAPHALASEFPARRPAPPVSAMSVHAPDPSSSQWSEMASPLSPLSLTVNPLAPYTPMAVTPASVYTPASTPADTIADIKMHSSSWYEPEKDRIVITDLDASSSDDEADVADDAPKLPRAVLQALLRGPERLPFVPLPPIQHSHLSLDPPSPSLGPTSLSEPGLDEAMCVEQ